MRKEKRLQNTNFLDFVAKSEPKGLGARRPDGRGRDEVAEVNSELFSATKGQTERLVDISNSMRRTRREKKRDNEVENISDI